MPSKGMDKLPVYEMVINENPESDVEVSSVAFVDKPAIEKNFLAFKDLKLNFDIDTERRIVSGPAMVANSLIYRRDENGEYNVFFSKETIEKIALKFFKKDYQKNLNLFHDPNLSLTGVTIFESFISDKARGIPPMKNYEDLPDGTWFISAKVENDQVWQKIKEGTVKGFSVEGIFSYVKKPSTIEDKVFALLSATGSGYSHLTENDCMTLLERIKNAKAAFDGTPLAAPAPPPAAPPAPGAVPPPPAAPAATFSDFTLKDGTAVKVDKLEPGGVMMIGDVPAPAGEHELADGTKVAVGEGGVISAVVPGMPAEPPLTMAAVSKAVADAINSFKEEMAAERLAAQQKLEKQDATLKGLFGLIEEIAQLPTADPVEPVKTSFQKQAATTKEQRRMELANNLSKLKKVS